MPKGPFKLSVSYGSKKWQECIKYHLNGPALHKLDVIILLYVDTFEKCQKIFTTEITKIVANY